MIPSVLAEALWKAARDHFTRGGSPMILVYAAGSVILLVAVLLVTQRLQLRTVKRRPADNPRKLFTNLVAQSGLPIMQREALRQMADDLRLSHPAVILLGPQVFKEHARRWAAAKTKPTPDSAPERLPESMVGLGNALFGSLFDPMDCSAATPNSESRRQIDDERPEPDISRQVTGNGHDSSN